jgi:hypothetical protein
MLSTKRKWEIESCPVIFTPFSSPWFFSQWSALINPSTITKNKYGDSISLFTCGCKTVILTNKTLHTLALSASPACKWSLTRGIYCGWKNQLSVVVREWEVIILIIITYLFYTHYYAFFFPWLLSEFSYILPLYFRVQHKTIIVTFITIV